MSTDNESEKVETKALSQDTYFGKDAFMLVEHINNDSDEKEYGDVVGETEGYFIVKPHLRKEQNRWLKVDCKVVEYYR
jgi:hypothetical protein